MKNLLLVLLMVAASTVLGQNIVDTSYRWNTVIGFESAYPEAATEIIRFTSDTVIDAITYKKVMRSLDENEVMWNPYGFIREDSNRVYYRMDSSDPEKLFYDFNLGHFDSVTVYGLFTFCNSAPYYGSATYYVTSEDSVLVGNSYKRQLHLSILLGCEFVEAEQWVEGMGSLGGVLHNYNLYVGCDGDLLLCFKVNDTLIYMDPGNVTCYVVVGLPEPLGPAHKILAFPNPAGDFIKFTLDEIIPGSILDFSMYDASGNIVIPLIRKKYSDDFVVNLTGIPHGAYFYRFSDNSGIIGQGRIVKE